MVMRFPEPVEPMRQLFMRTRYEKGRQHLWDAVERVYWAKKQIELAWIAAKGFPDQEAFFEPIYWQLDKFQDDLADKARELDEKEIP